MKLPSATTGRDKPTWSRDSSAQWMIPNPRAARNCQTPLSQGAVCCVPVRAHAPLETGMEAAPLLTSGLRSPGRSGAGYSGPAQGSPSQTWTCQVRPAGPVVLFWGIMLRLLRELCVMGKCGHVQTETVRSRPDTLARVSDSIAGDGDRVWYPLYLAHPARLGNVQLRTLQRRANDWRRVMAKRLVYVASDEPSAGLVRHRRISLGWIRNQTLEYR